jgi:hypothetical protein
MMGFGGFSAEKALTRRDISGKRYPPGSFRKLSLIFTMMSLLKLNLSVEDEFGGACQIDMIVDFIPVDVELAA